MLAINAVPPLRCDRCGNTSFNELWHCTTPGHNDCPFQRLQSSPRRYFLGFLIAAFGSFFLAAGIFFVIFMAGRYGVTWYFLLVLIIFLAVFLAFGGFAASLGLYLVFGSTRSLLHTQSATAWQESRILGFLLARRVVQRFAAESVPQPLRLHFPTSIAAVTETPSWQEIKQQIRHLGQVPPEERDRTMHDVTSNTAPGDLVLAVVLDLVSRGLLAGSRVRTWTSRFTSAQYKEEEEIVLTPGPEFVDIESSPSGDFERQILQLVTNWKSSTEAVDQPLGPTGKLLVRGILGTDRASPGGSLIQIPATDAVNTGLAVKTSRWLPTFKFNDDIKPTHDEDRRALLSWLRQYESLDWVRRLSEDIQAGIRSRETSD